LGALLVGGSFLAIGIAFSAIGSSQVGSFLLSAVVSFALIILGFDFVLLSTPASVSAVLAQVAILPHAQNISRGFLDFRDILYFLTIIAVFLMML
jgi:ABC-2 type transport system permease protein